ncbi:hypothetical protein [Lacrimispora indolis]|uniref:hypothetical protein n=1 Tax=Lacrimispora indolis TaxID=69825 RepID=UPI00045E63DB|nr:hypothetical protein [Lacrimispora indolis]
MDNKKRMMFVLDEDYYYVTLKILSTVFFISGFNKKFVDYKKLSFILEFCKSDYRLRLYEKAVSDRSLNVFEHEELTTIYCNANLNDSMIQRVLYFLEKQGIIHMSKNDRFGCIDLELVKSKDLESLFDSNILASERSNINIIKNNMTRIGTYKFDSFISKIYGKNEVAKWEE